MDIKKYLTKRLAHATKQVEELKQKQGDKPSSTHNYHGGWSAGYWDGKLAAYEDVLDEIEEMKAKNIEVIDGGPSKPYVKEPEELLANGTLVRVVGNEYKGVFKILWSLPSDIYPHRYHLEGYGFICEKSDLAIHKEGMQ